MYFSQSQADRLTQRSSTVTNGHISATTKLVLDFLTLTQRQRAPMSNPPPAPTHTLDEALSVVNDFGQYQKRLLVFLSLSQVLHSLLVSRGPHLEEYWHIFLILILGFSSVLGAGLSDIFGRRRVYLLTLALLILSLLSSFFLPPLTIVVTYYCCLGMNVGLAFIWIVESVGSHYHALVCSCLWTVVCSSFTVVGNHWVQVLDPIFLTAFLSGSYFILWALMHPLTCESPTWTLASCSSPAVTTSILEWIASQNDKSHLMAHFQFHFESTENDLQPHLVFPTLMVWSSWWIMGCCVPHFAAFDQYSTWTIIVIVIVLTWCSCDSIGRVSTLSFIMQLGLAGLSLTLALFQLELLARHQIWINIGLHLCLFSALGLVTVVFTVESSLTNSRGQVFGWGIFVAVCNSGFTRWLCLSPQSSVLWTGCCTGVWTLVFYFWEPMVDTKGQSLSVTVEANLEGEVHEHTPLIA